MSDIASPAVPDGWRWTTLAELSVGIYDCPHSTPKLAHEGPFVVRTQDIASGVFRHETAARVSLETYRDRVSRAEPRYGDIMYSREGAYFGVAAEVPQGVTLCLGQRMVLIRPEPDLADHSYLKYWLNSPFALRYAQGHREGSAAPRINLPLIRALPVIQPPLEVQRSIAATLGALDDKIESNRKTINLASQFLDAMAAKTAPHVPATTLGAVIRVSRDTINPAQLGDEIVDHYSLPAFDEGARPERAAATTIMSNKLRVAQRSILLSRLNPRFNRTWWVTPRNAICALASTEFLCLTATDAETLAAVWLIVRGEEFRSELVRRVTGTSGSHQRVRPDDVLDIEVPDITQSPNHTKREALALLETIEQRREEIARLRTVRASLVPELLFGRIRVPDARTPSAEDVA